MVPHGEVFETTAREEQIIATQGLAHWFPAVSSDPTMHVVSSVVGVDPQAVAAHLEQHQDEIRQVVRKRAPPAPKPTAVRPSPPVWPLSMAPALYLKLHPKGKHAALAKQIVEGA